MEWKKEAGGWGAMIDALYLGKWRVGTVGYDCGTGKTFANKYAAHSRMPGHKSLLGHYGTCEEAKERVEKAVNRWIKGAGLTVAPFEMDVEN
ncbi:hypothetical protein VPZ60_004325 [Salmonella enterica]|nr:hypothetical protein [Salmonella enterica]